MVIIGVSIAVVLVLVFGFWYLLVDKVLTNKARRDEKQMMASKCAAVADDFGLEGLAEMLRLFSVGAWLRAMRKIKEFFETICQNPEKIAELAYNVFCKTWSTLRDHPVYGDKAREKVVAEAFAIDIDDDSDIDIIAAAARCRAMGWESLAEAGEAWAKRRFREMTQTIRALFKECMTEDGVREIAKRVAPKTLKALMESKDEEDREFAKALIGKHAAKLGWTPPPTPPAAP